MLAASALPFLVLSYLTAVVSAVPVGFINNAELALNVARESLDPNVAVREIPALANTHWQAKRGDDDDDGGDKKDKKKAPAGFTAKLALELAGQALNGKQ